jgi:hypothetical protein
MTFLSNQKNLGMLLKVVTRRRKPKNFSNLDVNKVCKYLFFIIKVKVRNKVRKGLELGYKVRLGLENKNVSNLFSNHLKHKYLLYLSSLVRRLEKKQPTLQTPHYLSYPKILFSQIPKFT